MPGTTVPKLAILNSNAAGSKIDQDSYIWLPQSIAIMEYLEDLCDAYPQLSPVPSLRGGNDLAHRALICGSLGYVENFWSAGNLSLCFGSEAYNRLLNEDNLNVLAAHLSTKIIQKKFLKPWNDLVGRACDFASVGQDIEGGATIADIAIYASLAFYRNAYGSHIVKGFPNLEKLEIAFEKRASSLADIPKDGYPVWSKVFRTGWLENPWPLADLDQIDARIHR